MSKVVALRPAAATDVNALCRLLTEMQLPVVGVREWWQQFSVAETDEGIVGLAGVETYADGALLRSVAVHQAMRGDSSKEPHLADSPGRAGNDLVRALP